MHASKGNAECKYWLLQQEYDIEQAHAYGMTLRDNREIRKIIFDHFDYILEQWNKMQEQG